MLVNNHSIKELNQAAQNKIYQDLITMIRFFIRHKNVKDLIITHKHLEALDIFMKKMALLDITRYTSDVLNVELW
ncbi:hypothetical protein HNY73_011316 [Argiope bruennichi]|uniref:Uncharacterized protein n=1 Tax=Argiope bruennichi TaxID=94029 RepID=A0A8T0F5X3_ARGBR|nr:hypothetical protein HNY73_011316 [Argiope bruennichi]